MIAWQEDGFTYEREAISKWLKDHDTSPKTGEPLQSKALIPNHVCRAMIRDFQEAHRPNALSLIRRRLPGCSSPRGQSSSSRRGPRRRQLPRVRALGCGRRVWGMVDGEGVHETVR